MSNAAITCPVSVNRINENVARVAAFFTIVTTFVIIYFNSAVLALLLAADFFLRAFTKGRYSPLKIASKRFADYAGLDEKPADAAPKKFAAGIGFVFSLAIAALLFLQYNVAAYSVAGVLIICAALESFKGFCLGCVVYTYVVLPFLNKANS